jgi:hypothetical protein
MWFLASIECLKIPALADRYDNPVPTRFLAPRKLLKLPVLACMHVSLRLVLVGVLVIGFGLRMRLNKLCSVTKLGTNDAVFLLPIELTSSSELIPFA